jgi:nucleotide-binding universal stress UspA family protein
MKEKYMKILVGYDGSNAAKEAMTQAAKQAKAFGGNVTVLVSLTGGTVTHETELAQANEDIKFAEKVFKDAGVACEIKLMIRGNTPGVDMVEFARENNVDMIVIGIRRRSKLDKLLFGSNAQYIVIKAHCPVLCVK